MLLVLLSATASGCAGLGEPGPTAKLSAVRPAPTGAARAPESPADGYYADAAQAIASRDYGRALDLLQLARQRAPADVRVLNAFGVVYDKLGRFDLSARYYAQAQELDPKSPILAANLAYSHVLQGRPDAKSPAAASVQLAEVAPQRVAPDRAEGPPEPIRLTREDDDPPAPIKTKAVAPEAPAAKPAAPTHLARQDAPVAAPVKTKVPAPEAQNGRVVAPLRIAGPPALAPATAMAPAAASVVLANSKALGHDPAPARTAVPTQASRAAVGARLVVHTPAAPEPKAAAPVLEAAVATPIPLRVTAPWSESRRQKEPVAMPAVVRTANAPVASTLITRLRFDPQPAAATPAPIANPTMAAKRAAIRPNPAAQPVSTQAPPPAALAVMRKADQPAGLARASLMLAPAPQTARQASHSLAATPLAPSKVLAHATTPTGAAPPALKRAMAPAPADRQRADRRSSFWNHVSPLILVNASGRQDRVESLRTDLVRIGWSAPGWAVQQAPRQTITVIRYPLARRPIAQALASTLPGQVRLSPCVFRCGGLQLVLGSDSLSWGHAKHWAPARRRS